MRSSRCPTNEAEVVMYEEQSYVLADGAGVCRYATPPALALLGIEPATLSQLRVGDLSCPAIAPDAFRQQVQASAHCVGRWLTGEVELFRPDAYLVIVPFALLRRPTGEIIVRFDRPESSAPAPHVRVRDVLEAWRREEQAVSETPVGTPEHLLAEAEVDRLSAEYQRLAADRARQIANQR
jgi:hypothetical protein